MQKDNLTQTLNTYPIVLFFSAKDNCWIADYPDLRYCSAHGETAEEALAEVKIAGQLWLETHFDEQKPLPKPSLTNLLHNREMAYA